MSINTFYENTKDGGPNTNAAWFVKQHTQPGVAVDLGCGAGRDSVFLLKNGWKVYSYDIVDTTSFFGKKLTDEEKSRFTFVESSIQDAVLPKCDLVIANFSLQNIKKEEFKPIVEKINNSLNPKGQFLALLWGDKDSWAKTNPNMAFFSKDEVEKMLQDKFEIKFSKGWQKEKAIMGDNTEKFADYISIVAETKNKDLIHQNRKEDEAER